MNKILLLCLTLSLTACYNREDNISLFDKYKKDCESRGYYIQQNMYMPKDFISNKINLYCSNSQTETIIF